MAGPQRAGEGSHGPERPAQGAERPAQGAERPAPARPGPEGLCPHCPHVRRIQSERGSVFLLCELSRSDQRFPRYPPQPRVVCSGYPR
jgi:hypothetical protein